MNPMRESKRGFTLTELLVVIAIIMGLAATAIPALQAFRRGQRLDHTARVITSALADARRLAVSKHARHVIVLYRYNDTSPQIQGTLEATRDAMRVYCEPVGDPSWPKGYWKGGYVGEPVILPPGLRFAQNLIKFAQVFGPVADPTMPLPLDNAYFQKSPNSKAIGYHRDGTFDYDPSLDEPAVNAAVGRNIYQPDEGFYQVPETTKADIVVVEVTPDGSEVVVKGKRRRALIDLQPMTGRATAAIFEIGDSFQSLQGTTQP
jgi:prepilin-type N-terminal cleavage/methylation domain-containing protein